MSASTAALRADQIAFGKLLWVGPLAVAASVIANVLLRFIAVAAFNPPAEFMPLSIGMPVFFTLVGCTLAVVVFALVGRFARQPIRTYQIIAVVALAISLVPDILLLATAEASPFPGATPGTVGSLMVMHVAAWAITVTLLTRFARES